MPQNFSRDKQGVAEFRKIVLRHYRTHGRDLPWRSQAFGARKDGALWAYHILVSEMMLQQTQVARVLPFYARFLKQFPSFRALARAKTADVLRAWQGLGYNRRALYLKRAAEDVLCRYGGTLPPDPEMLKKLPGIGAATAGAIAAFAFNKPVVFIETNIRRALLHHFFPQRSRVADRELAPLLRAALDRRRPREWYWALMDYGAALGARLPKSANPNRRSRHYARQPRFEGSHRKLRGQILRAALQNKSSSARIIARRLKAPAREVMRTLRELRREGFIFLARKPRA
jgi:A/G-specific adenine glycosylase